MAFSNWCRQNNVSLKQAAADLRVAPSTINSLALGKRFPGGHQFEKIVDYTGLPPCRLFCVESHKCVPTECLLGLPQKPVS